MEHPPQERSSHQHVAAHLRKIDPEQRATSPVKAFCQLRNFIV
jgi:hypothetical protein